MYYLSVYKHKELSIDISQHCIAVDFLCRKNLLPVTFASNTIK